MRALAADARPRAGSSTDGQTAPSGRLHSDVLILGLGSPIMSDDAVGLHVARELRRLIGPEAADVDEASTTGLRLLDLIQGYRKLIVIDATHTGKAPPGTLHHVPLKMRPGTQRLMWQHGIDFATTLRLGRRIGMRVPCVVAVYGVEVRDPYCFGDELSPEIKDAVPSIARTIAREAFPHLDGREKA